MTWFRPTAHVNLGPGARRRVAVPTSTLLPTSTVSLEKAMGREHDQLPEMGGVLFQGHAPGGRLIDGETTQVRHLQQGATWWLRRNRFGNTSELDVVVEAVEQLYRNAEHPAVPTRQRVCRESCGSVAGYRDLISVFGSAERKDRRYAVTWAPAVLDAAAFDLVAANRRVCAR